MADAAAHSVQPVSPPAISARPATGLVLALIFGILLHRRVPHHPDILIFFICSLTILATITFRRASLSSALLFLALILCAIGLAQREHFQFAANDVGLFAGDESQLVELQLRLLDDPQVVSTSSPRPLPSKESAVAQVLRIRLTGGWTQATGRLPVVFDQINPNLMAGQIVRVIGMLQQPAVPMNPGQMDWASIYRNQRQLATFTVRHAENLQVLDSSPPSWLTTLRSKTRDLLEAGFRDDQAADHSLLAKLVLGERDSQFRADQDLFQQTGLGYQLNVSGLHVALLGALVLLVARRFLISPSLALLLSTAVVLLYVSVAVPSYSGVRGAIVWLAVALAMWTSRSTDRFQLLSLAIAAMLLLHPLDLYSVGFQLSFAAIFSLVLIYPAVESWMFELQDPDLLLAPRSKKSELAEMTLRFARVVRRLFLLDIIAWVGVMPLVLFYFGELNCWVILTAAITVVPVLLALVVGIFKIILTLLWPSTAGLWAKFAVLPVTILRLLMERLAHLPGMHWRLVAPSIFLIAIFYLLLTLPFWPWLGFISGRKRWLVRLAPLAGVALLLLPTGTDASHLPDEMRVTLLSLGAGQCAVIEPPNSEPIIIDAGSSSIDDVADKIAEPFLRSQHEHSVSEIFLSHGDYDHISAAGELAGAFKAREVFISPHFRPNAEGNLPDQQLLETFDQLNLPPHLISMGDHVEADSQSRLDVLWPPADGTWNSNNAGLVLRLTYAGRTVLFPADIQDPAMMALLKHPEQLKADILIAAHHGSSEKTTPAFVNAVHPSMILSSNAWHLTNKQKRFETMIDHIPLYRTNKFGAITVIIKSDGTITVTTFIKPHQVK